MPTPGKATARSNSVAAGRSTLQGTLVPCLTCFPRHLLAGDSHVLKPFACPLLALLPPGLLLLLGLLPGRKAQRLAFYLPPAGPVPDPAWPAHTDLSGCSAGTAAACCLSPHACPAPASIGPEHAVCADTQASSCLLAEIPCLQPGIACSARSRAGLLLSPVVPLPFWPDPRMAEHAVWYQCRLDVCLAGGASSPVSVELAGLDGWSSLPVQPDPCTARACQSRQKPGKAMAYSIADCHQQISIAQAAHNAGISAHLIYFC